MASRGVAVAAGVSAAILFSAGPSAAGGVAHWPCKAPYKDAVTVEDVWGGPAPAADGDWRDDAGVRKLVIFVINPENSPAEGRKAIADFAAAAGDGKARALPLVLRGMVDETNELRQAIITGVRDMTNRGVILGDAVRENDEALANLPANAETERDAIKMARKVNFRNKDDAEEEADFLCYRLAYVEKKVRLLADELRGRLAAR